MKVAVAITGASGSIYASQLLKNLTQQEDLTVGVVMSKNAELVWELELGNSSYKDFNCTFWDKNNFMAPIASGSAGWDALVIVPCSMGMIGRIASGISDDLVTRAADVMMKERKKLICIPRESPYNLVHLRNMTTITEAGGIIVPASPSFYSQPQTFEALADTIVHRILDLLHIKHDTYRWGN